MRSISFLIEGLTGTRISIFEEADGSLRFEISSESGEALNIRALFFDLNDEYKSLADGLSLLGDDVDLTKIGDGDVTKVGSGTSITGDVVNEFGAFDAGVSFEDTLSGDLSITTFTLSHDTTALDLDMFSLADFAVRLDGGEPKAGDVSTMALLASDDSYELAENTLATGNFLTNDRQSDGLAVTEAAIGGLILPLGVWTDVTTDGGRVGRVLIGSDGAVQFDAPESFDDLNVNDIDTLTLSYATADAFGSRDSAEVSIVVTGVNDDPTVNGALSRSSDEDSALRVDLLEGAEDKDNGAVLAAVDVTEGTGQGGWSLDGNSIVIDPAYFDSLAAETSARLELNYFVEDEWGARVAQSLTLDITGLNDTPTVVGSLSRVVSEDDVAFSVDLLEGAQDVDIGAVLSAADVSEAAGKTGWSLNGNAIEIDPDFFTGLKEGASEELSFTYIVQDEWGASVEQSLGVTIEGRNDAPMVAAALETTVSEEDAVFTLDLLAGAADVDDEAVLNAVGLTEASGQDGWSIEGNAIAIDPNYFDDLNDGDLGQLVFNYAVRDEFGAEVAQSLTVNVEGYTDAPFVSVQLGAGSAANIVLLAVTTEQARDEAVALSFGGLPAGAIVRDAAGSDVTSGVSDALGTTTYVLELPLGTDVDDFIVTVAGLEPDGTVIGTRDAVVELGYEAVTTTNTMTFEANDQDLWGSDEEFFYSISEYFPLLGGQRENFKLLDASTDQGQVFIKNGEIEWIPGSAYGDLPQGEPATVTFQFSYIEVDADGIELAGAPIQIETLDILATGGNFFTEFSGDYVSQRDEVVSIEPLRTVDVLMDPLSTGIIELIDIDLDSDDIFGSLIDPFVDARDGLASLLEADEAKLAQAIADRDAVADEAALLTVLFTQRAEVVARQVVYDTANTAFSLIGGAFEQFQKALDDADSALTSAQSSLTSAKKKTADKKQAYDDSIVTIWGVNVGSATKYAAWKAAQLVQTAAQTAVNLASKAVDLAQAALDAFDDSEGATFLQTQLDNALIELNNAKADVAATENQLGEYYADPSEVDAVDLARATGELTVAQGEVVFYEGTTFGLNALRATAQGVLDGLQAVIDTTDFRALLYASAEAYAQAGFQFDFAISGGTVDAAVEYELTTVSGYNEATDVMTIEVVLENMTTDEDVAFSTVSPNVQIYAGLLYDMGANFEFIADFYAAIGNVVLADLSPDSDGLSITPMPNIEGSVDFIDFDSRDGGEINLGFSSGNELSPEVLDFTLAIPTIETLGREVDPSIDYYQEGDLFELDFGELLGSFRNLVEARIDLSPEMKALLNQAGINPADPADEFFQALFQALGVAVNSAIGEGDTDGDGVVPLFLLDATDETSGALLHINSVPDDLTGIDPDTLGQFGFYAAYGESDRVVEVTLDVDQLVAWIANRASGNPTPVVFNPLDLQLDLAELIGTEDMNDEDARGILDIFELTLNAEFADLDVSTGLNFSQEFTLAMDDFDFVFTMENGEVITRTAADPSLTLTNASQYDANGDGSIDYNLSLTPNAAFSNDTELGLGFSYALDFIKTSFAAGITIPLEEVFGSKLDLLGLESDEAKIDLFNSAIGPLFRVQGDIDAVTLDVFEDRFALDMGTQSFDLSSDEFAFV